MGKFRIARHVVIGMILVSLEQMSQRPSSMAGIDGSPMMANGTRALDFGSGGDSFRLPTSRCMDWDFRRSPIGIL